MIDRLRLRRLKLISTLLSIVAGLTAALLVAAAPGPAHSSRTASDVADAASCGSGQSIADIADSCLGRHMGTKKDPTGDPPSWYEWWCADFAKYVWGKAGADTTGLTAAAASFAYGYAHGPLSSTPAAGDVMVVGTSPSDQASGNVTHVAIVTSVNGAQVTTVGGDEGSGMWYDNSVVQQTTGSAVGAYFGTGSLDGTHVVDVYVYGYAVPSFASPQAMVNGQPSSQSSSQGSTIDRSLQVADGGLAGEYVSAPADGGTPVQAGGGSPESYTFTPVPGESGAYYIRPDGGGGYLSARFDLAGDQRGSLYADVSQPGLWETFHEQQVGGDVAFYVYDSAGAKWYVSTEMNRGGILRARTPQDQFDQNTGSGSWELFSLGT